ncbi:MAG: rhodanese-like domain-containing protein [Cocleimonas sp.]|nr:rhodanese-like domain-containing protein [Cocleimonas sp.]
MIKYRWIIVLSILLSACGGSGSTTSSQGLSAEPIPQSDGYSNINNAHLEKMMKEGITLIDIRLKEEWQQTGIIKGSKTLTFFDRNGRINPKFVPEINRLVRPDQPVALICRTGNRTRAASQAIAQQLGYKKVYNVTHGITGWIAEKRPVVAYQ